MFYCNALYRQAFSTEACTFSDHVRGCDPSVTTDGFRLPAGQYKRYKDCLKSTMTQCGITPSELETLAMDRAGLRSVDMIHSSYYMHSPWVNEINFCRFLYSMFNHSYLGYCGPRVLKTVYLWLQKLVLWFY